MRDEDKEAYAAEEARQWQKRVAALWRGYLAVLAGLMAGLVLAAAVAPAAVASFATALLVSALPFLALLVLIGCREAYFAA